MTIGGVSCGARNTPAVDTPTKWVSAGISMNADVTRTDFGKKAQDIPVHFSLMTQTTKDSLKTALMDTAGPYGTVSVTPDTNDDLGIGASGAVNLIFLTFSAQYVAGDRWAVDVLFRKYT